MSSKRKGGDPNLPNKKHRKVLCLGEKIKILDKLNSGRSAASVASDYGVNESTIRYIKKAEEKIRNSVKSAAEPSLKVASVSRRDPLLEKMERLLNIWMEDQTQKNAPLSGLIIRNKALSIYDSLKTSEACASNNPEKPFQASRGWFENFKTRFNLHNLKLVGESASADHEAARKYPDELATYIREKGYHTDQVFNADETGLFWKKMPSRTYISRDERTAPGFKVAKDRLTLLFCGNASGDFRCKPMLVYRAQNPRALKNENKNDLPVFWRANRRAWVTSQLFEDWFNNCFVKEVRTYLGRKNLSFKVLLLVDNAPGHPETLSKDPNVEVKFLPPNTTSLLQPMDQGIIATFKSYYTRRSFAHILHTLEEDSTLTVKDCWSRFNILTAINIIGASWEEINSSTLNACWRKLWPECVLQSVQVPNSRKEIEKVVEIAKRVGREGFEDVEAEDIEELINEPADDLNVQELLEMSSIDNIEYNTESDSDEERNLPTLNTKVLRELLETIAQLKNKISSMDPDLERSLLVNRKIEDAILPYRQIYMELKNPRQQSIKEFFKTTDTQSGTSAQKD